MSIGSANAAPIRVNASLTVRPRLSPDVSDSFSCYIQKQQQHNNRPCHIREDIIVPNVDCARTTGYACIVRIDDGPLATLLGDSEGPAHTSGKRLRATSKTINVYGGLAISFVSNFPGELIRRIHATSKDLDRTLLSDPFKIEDRSQRMMLAPEPKPGEDPPPRPEFPQPTSPRFRITQTRAGFAVNSVDGRLPVGTQLRIFAPLTKQPREIHSRLTASTISISAKDSNYERLHPEASNRRMRSSSASTQPILNLVYHRFRCQSRCRRPSESRQIDRRRTSRRGTGGRCRLSV